jgi:hypothetical protein
MSKTQRRDIEEPQTPLEEAARILREETKERDDDGPEIDRLTPREIHRFTAVFQPRGMEYGKLEEAALMKELRDAIGDLKKPKALPAITVWWSGKFFYCLDGHHRQLAYKQRGMADWPVPVEVFSGNLEDAVLRSISSNSHNRLRFTERDRLNSVWRTVKYFDEQPARVIADKTGVSVRTVKNMRQTREALKKADTPLEDMPKDWSEAKYMLKNRDRPADHILEAQFERAAKDLTIQLKGAFGRIIAKNPDLFAKALAGIDPKFPENMIDSRYWRDAYEAVKEREENSDY